MAGSALSFITQTPLDNHNASISGGANISDTSYYSTMENKLKVLPPLPSIPFEQVKD
jgi:hypothetical protein